MDIVKISKDNLRRQLPEFQYGSCWLGGGAVRDSILLEKYSDIDIFGSSKEGLDTFIDANLKECKEIFTSDRMRTFTKGNDKVQVIYILSETIEKCLDSFDFTLCQFAYDGNSVYCNPQSLVDIFRKRIVIHKLSNEFVIDSLRRMQKYIKKGYTICNGGLATFIETIRQATPEQIENQMDFYPDTKEGKRIRRIMRFD